MDTFVHISIILESQIHNNGIILGSYVGKSLMKLTEFQISHSTRQKIYLLISCLSSETKNVFSC